MNNAISDIPLQSPYTVFCHHRSYRSEASGIRAVSRPRPLDAPHKENRTFGFSSVFGVIPYKAISISSVVQIVRDPEMLTLWT